MRRLNSSGRFIFRGGPIELVYRLEVNGTLIVSFAKLPFTFPLFAISVFTRCKSWNNSGENHVLCRCKKKKTQSISCYRRRCIHIHVHIYLGLPSYLLFIVFITLSCFVVVAFGHCLQLGLVAAMSFLFTFT